MLHNKNKGQALLIVSAFVGIVLIFGFITVSNTTQFNRTINIIDERAKAQQAAEAGLAKSIWCLNQATGDNCGGTHGSSYAGESDIFIGNASFSTSITDKDSNTKTITSTGFFPNSTSTRYSIAVKQEATINTDSVSFYFGALVGDGGLVMDHDSLVENGNVYSNGDIEGDGEIEGDVFVAGGTSPAADQQDINFSSGFIFGKSSDPNKCDIAQSFKPSISEKLNKVSFYIKKTGYPYNASVKIVSDNGGKPSKTSLGSGTLNASKVTSSYYWTDVNMSSPPQLTAGTTYWILIDASCYSSNYWTIGFDSADSYPDGTGKYSPNWNVQTPSWYGASGDFNFKAYLGGVITSLSGVHVDGDAHANTISNTIIGGDSFSKILYYAVVGGNASSNEITSTVVGYNASSTYIFYSTIGHNAYCQVISGSIVGWHTYCPSEVAPPEDPAPRDMPISDAQIAEWKKDASDGGTIEGDYEPAEDATVYLGPIKITGDLLLENKQHLILTGGVYVQGNVEIGNQATVRLDSSYGQSSGFIIADGTLHVENHGGFGGSGEENSTLLLAALAAGGGDHDSAIDLHNNATGAVFYAPNGMIYLHNWVHVSELTGKKIHMGEHTHLNYDTGLADAVFTSGPGGAWELKTGTWRIVK